jgi:hypothetical protein
LWKVSVTASPFWVNSAPQKLGRGGHDRDRGEPGRLLAREDHRRQQRESARCVGLRLCFERGFEPIAVYRSSRRASIWRSRFTNQPK